MFSSENGCVIAALQQFVPMIYVIYLLSAEIRLPSEDFPPVVISSCIYSKEPKRILCIITLYCSQLAHECYIKTYRQNPVARAQHHRDIILKCYHVFVELS